MDQLWIRSNHFIRNRRFSPQKQRLPFRPYVSLDFGTNHQLMTTDTPCGGMNSELLCQNIRETGLPLRNSTEKDR
jgi:hypothetical protein